MSPQHHAQDPATTNPPRHDMQDPTANLPPRHLNTDPDQRNRLAGRRLPVAQMPLAGPYEALGRSSGRA
ncbi:hypothetical protein EDB89DRAFT_2077413 [Lactarius sanguifluus]|nr:hypothetical protein EDB89DRAFT_2077413 [Lactarius sanguifluus]